MKHLSCAGAVAALVFLSGAAFAKPAGVFTSSAHVGHVSGPSLGIGRPALGGLGRYRGPIGRSGWFSGGWPDAPQTRHWNGNYHHRPGHGHGGHDGPWDHGGSYAAWGYGAFPGFWGYGSWDDNGGYALTEPSADMFGFYGAGGDVDLINGSAVYQYDRSYPYDWYHGAPAASVTVHRAAQTRCEVQTVPDGKGRGTTSVRICRR